MFARGRWRTIVIGTDTCVWIGLHDASFPHTLVAVAFGSQTKQQYLSPADEDNAHCGEAVTPEGTSVGHVLLVHSGEQISPNTPCIWMEISSFSQLCL